MEEFPCKVKISTLDRRKRHSTEKIHEQDTYFSARHIEEDKSFHMVIKHGTRVEAFISSKLQISDNVSTLGSIALNIPEFRSLVVIEEAEEGNVLKNIMDILSPTSIKATVEEVSFITDKENVNPSVNKPSMDNQSTPEKCGRSAADKVKLRSPLKTGLTPTKKKERLCILGEFSTKSSPKSSFLSSIVNAGVHARARTFLGSSPENNSLTLTEMQLQVIERCKEGSNVFLTGGAGTGKSHLLKCILDEMVKLHGKQSVFVTATTGMAAVNIGGTTVHQFAGIRPGDTVSILGDSFKQVLVLEVDLLHAISRSNCA